MKTPIKRENLFNTLWLIILCAACFGIGWVVNERLRSPDEKLIDTARRLIVNESIFNQGSERELSYAAIRGMLSTVNDPYAELIKPDAAQNFTDTFTGKTGVVGLYAENQAGKVVITIVFPNGPAASAGLQVGDVIQSIDGTPLEKEADSSETGLLMRGPIGSRLHLQILRGEQVLEFDIIRQEREFVATRMLPEGIGYISLNAFNENSSQQMKKELEALLAQKPTALIWDLRANEGGDMQAAQEILSYFINDGLLFSAELTDDRRVQFFAKGGAIAGDIPLMVLMDKTTYSAAETAAAAIADTGRGTTVGSDSFGKGLIQATIPLTDGSMLQMTVAKWLSIRGEWYHGHGVPAQIAAIDDPATEEDEVLQKAIDSLSTR
jgi:carboxyl-terminal processing protease